ncbi:MAG: hypothetical protein ACKV22_24705 [Bryobacteraceae bacterium]
MLLALLLAGPWQLFVDDHLIAEKQGVVRTYHAFEKHAANPVLQAEKPWEGRGIYLYGTVLKQAAGYRMWYHISDKNRYRTAYATSQDGLRWDRPDLGKGDNLLFPDSFGGHMPQVIHRPWDAEPYKMMLYDYGRSPPEYLVSGFLAFASKDGLKWRPMGREPALPDPGDVGSFVWDPHQRRFAGYPKTFSWVRGFRRRSVGFTATADFSRWPPAELILTPDRFDDRWVRSEGQHTDFYGLSAFAYESQYLGFLWVFRISEGSNHGPIFLELVSSRDGITWQRQEGDRSPVLPLGPPESWDRGMVFPASHPLVEADRVKLYYGGFTDEHTGNGVGAIGLATIRKDGFASLNGSGEVTTKPLAGLSGTLRVNSSGTLRVEVLDTAGRVVPGFGREDCVSLRGDGVDVPVRWKRGSALPAGASRVRFVLEPAALYSFRAGGPVTLAKPDSAKQVRGTEGTRHLGREFTLRARARPGNERTTLFSHYRGRGEPATGELVFDVNAASGVVRLIVNGQSVESQPRFFRDKRPHDFAATYRSGLIRLYLDGRMVGEDRLRPGSAHLFHDGTLIRHYGERGAASLAGIHLGDDLETSPDLAQDASVAWRALSPSEIMRVHQDR